MATDQFESQSEIIKCFSGKSVLITGASGFIGKALVYKLLRSCPKIDQIFILLREKKGLGCEQRMKKILENDCFDTIKHTNEALLDKVKPIYGDISIEGLGISEDQLKILRSNVSIVIHSAATVRFNESLREAVNVNILGTQRMLKLAKSLPKIKAFIHVSTCYSNCHLNDTIENKVYQQNIDPQDLIDLTRWMPDDMIEDILPKLLDKRPNTYTLTKALTETLIAQESDSLPIAIIRPSVVTSAFSEPYEGWVDNLNNLAGITSTIFKGLTRTMLGKPDSRLDLIPVDMVVNMIIATAWHVINGININNNNQQHRNPPIVIHCSSGDKNPLKMKDLVTHVCDNIAIYPDHQALRAPSFQLASSKFVKKAIQFADQYIPCSVMDGLQALVGRKPILIKTCSKVNKMIESFEFFTSNEWTFESTNATLLFESLNLADKKIFNFDVESINWATYIKTIVIGVREFTSNIKDDKDTLNNARIKIQRKLMTERLIKVTVSLLVALSFFNLQSWLKIGL